MPTLTWIGKEKVVNHHHEVPYKVLNHSYSFNGSHPEQESPNKIIHGDNLEALKSLLPEYEGKIKCCYLDPPYNTGNEGWVYNDNVSDPRFKRWLGHVVGKESEDLSRHDKWLCMMYPRLVMLHKLLTKDGVIFVSIDDNEQSHLKLVCDEVFGINNFVANIVWQHSIQPKGYLGKVSIHHNHTLVYSKNTDFVLGNLARTAEHNIAYSNPDDDPNGPWRTGDVRNSLYRPNLIYEIISPSGQKISPPKNGWRWSRETLNKKISTGEIVFNKEETNIIRKIYLNTLEGRAPESIWFGQEVGTTRTANKVLKDIFEEEFLFDTPKPVELIQRILQIATAPDSIILDSFAGSGTTAHAVLNLNKRDGGNRKFILIEMEDYAETITAERVKRVINGYADKPGTGGSFSYYELGEPLFIGDNNEYLNEAVGTDKIKSYIWYTETRTTYQPEDSFNEAFLGVHEQTALYFIYSPHQLTALDFDTLALVTAEANLYIIYADNCLLPRDFLLRHHIIFKKIPRDISRL